MASDCRKDVVDSASSSEDLQQEPSQVELFQKFLLVQMQSKLLDYFSRPASERAEDDTMSRDAENLNSVKQTVFENEGEVAKKFSKLSEMSKVIEAGVEEEKLKEAERFFEMKSQVAQLENSLKTFIAEHGADLDSSIAMCNDQAEKLAREKNRLKRLDALNSQLKLELSCLEGTKPHGSHY